MPRLNGWARPRARAIVRIVAEDEAVVLVGPQQLLAPPSLPMTIRQHRCCCSGEAEPRNLPKDLAIQIGDDAGDVAGLDAAVRTATGSTAAMHRWPTFNSCR